MLISIKGRILSMKNKGKSVELTYHEQKHIDYTQKLREVLRTLPTFAMDYFRSLENSNTSPKTRISYGYDIRIFFYFLTQMNPEFKNREITTIKLIDIEKLEVVDIEEYLDFLKYYTDADGVTHTNGERGIHRKLAALRSFYNYYYKRQRINNNPTVIVDMPKLHDREITRLDADEVAALLDLVEHGESSISGMKRVYFERNKVRNLAIFTLLLGTGIRVSECVGLDLTDIDFKNNRIRVVRKGGNEEFVYFGEEVETALERYIEIRKSIIAHIGHTNALFLSIQKKRISIQAIENLVKEYASKITTVKHITPHKLRSTFGTSLYRETNDIYLVAEVLGHNDVNTTKKHYAALGDDLKRAASRKVHLRND